MMDVEKSQVEKTLEPRAEVWNAFWEQRGQKKPGALGQRIFDEIQRGVDVAGREVLELGCGCGELLRLALDAGAKRAIGVDMSSEALKLADEMLVGRNYELIEQDMFSLADDVKADIVWSSGVVEHFEGERLIEVMKLHRRLSRKYVVVIVPASPHWNDIRMRQKKSLEKYGWQIPLSKRKLGRIGEKADLKLIGARRFMMEYAVDSAWVRRYLFSFRSRWAGIDQLLGGLAVAWYQRVDNMQNSESDVLPR